MYRSDLKNRDRSGAIAAVIALHAGLLREAEARAARVERALEISPHVLEDDALDGHDEVTRDQERALRALRPLTGET